MRALPLATFVVAGLCPWSSLAAQFGGAGGDGAFVPTADVVLDTTARPGGWSFTSIYVPDGVTLYLRGDHPARISCRGDVRIDGRVLAEGRLAVGDQPGAGGPGGFAGGMPGVAGDGPAGGSPGIGELYSNTWGGNGGHATPGRGFQMQRTGTYGGVLPFDLRGGSGGGGYASSVSGIQLGGHGGGGVLILAADGVIEVNGSISVDGVGDGMTRSGAGGSLLIRSARSIRVDGSLTARGPTDGLPLPISGSAGDGFIRLDAWAGSPEIGIAATIDPAPELLSLPELGATPAIRGRNWTLRARAIPGDTVAFLFSAEAGDVSVPGLGRYRLGAPNRTFVVGSVTVPSGHDSRATLNVPVPADPNLLGVAANAQALVTVTSASSGPRLSNAVFDVFR